MPCLATVLQENHIPRPLSHIVFAIANATKDLALLIRQGALGNVLGSTLNKNVQGETQSNLDIVANNLLKETLTAQPSVMAIASEEEPLVVGVNEGGHYVVAFDPLDGSSNIDVNGPIGTIFSIFKSLKQFSYDSEEQFLQPGKQQVCAGYVLYGPSTLLILSTGGDVQCFTLDDSSGLYQLCQQSLLVPHDCSEFAINMSNHRFWADNFKRYVADLLMGETGVRARNFTMRWNGSMVGDIHRIMQRGGIFLYPENHFSHQLPAKLRLLYEANPMAMLIEKAGGLAFSNKTPICELRPRSLHERVAVVLGSKNEVELHLSYS